MKHLYIFFTDSHVNSFIFQASPLSQCFIETTTKFPFGFVFAFWKKKTFWFCNQMQISVCFTQEQVIHFYKFAFLHQQIVHQLTKS